MMENRHREKDQSNSKSNNGYDVLKETCVSSQKSGDGKKYDVLRMACKEQGEENGENVNNLLGSIREAINNLTEYGKNKDTINIKENIVNIAKNMSCTEFIIEGYVREKKYNNWRSKIEEVTELADGIKRLTESQENSIDTEKLFDIDRKIKRLNRDLLVTEGLDANLLEDVLKSQEQLNDGEFGKGQQQEKVELEQKLKQLENIVKINCNIDNSTRYSTNDAMININKNNISINILITERFINEFIREEKYNICKYKVKEVKELIDALKYLTESKEKNVNTKDVLNITQKLNEKLETLNKDLAGEDNFNTFQKEIRRVIESQQKLNQLESDFLLQKGQKGPNWYYQYADCQKSQSQDSQLQSSPLKQLGKYKIIKVLGKGGFGKVFYGRHVDTGEEVAIKVPIGKNGNIKQGGVNNILTDIKNMVSLNHKNIVPLLGFGRQGNVPYLVMEYMPSGTLDRKSLHYTDIVEKMGWICDGVDYMHEQGLIHQDLKPENILLRENGEAVVGDPGLAAKVDTDEAKGGAGTDLYKAHEQWGKSLWSEDLSHMQTLGKRNTEAHARKQSDVYALALIAFELATGKRLIECMKEDNKYLQLLDNKKIKWKNKYQQKANDNDLEYFWKNNKAQRWLHKRTGEWLHTNYNDKFLQALVPALESDPTKRIQSAKALLDALKEGLREQKDFVRSLGIKGAKKHYMGIKQQENRVKMYKMLRPEQQKGLIRVLEDNYVMQLVQEFEDKNVKKLYIGMQGQKERTRVYRMLRPEQQKDLIRALEDDNVKELVRELGDEDVKRLYIGTQKREERTRLCKMLVQNGQLGNIIRTLSNSSIKMLVRDLGDEDVKRLYIGMQEQKERTRLCKVLVQDGRHGKLVRKLGDENVKMLVRELGDENIKMFVRKLDNDDVKMLVRKLDNDDVKMLVRELGDENIKMFVRKLDDDDIKMLVRKLDNDDVKMLVRKLDNDDVKMLGSEGIWQLYQGLEERTARTHLYEMLDPEQQKDLKSKEIVKNRSRISKALEGLISEDYDCKVNIEKMQENITRIYSEMLYIYKKLDKDVKEDKKDNSWKIKLIGIKIEADKLNKHIMEDIYTEMNKYNNSIKHIKFLNDFLEQTNKQLDEKRQTFVDRCDELRRIGTLERTNSRGQSDEGLQRRPINEVQKSNPPSIIDASTSAPQNGERNPSTVRMEGQEKRGRQNRAGERRRMQQQQLPAMEKNQDLYPPFPIAANHLDKNLCPPTPKRSRWKFNLPWQQWFSRKGKSDSHGNHAQQDKRHFIRNCWSSCFRAKTEE
jgi:serine/threonine protein kinase/Mg/Co/Ni transporter MgtE